MNKPHIHVYLQPRKYPSKDDENIVVEVPEDMFFCMQTIDEPAPGADALISALMCTPTITRTEVKAKRRDIARMLAEHLTTALLDAMAKNDTVMGYKKDET